LDLDLDLDFLADFLDLDLDLDLDIERLDFFDLDLDLDLDFLTDFLEDLFFLAPPVRGTNSSRAVWSLGSSVDI
jgi:hypothetical protein